MKTRVGDERLAHEPAQDIAHPRIIAVQAAAAADEIMDAINDPALPLDMRKLLAALLYQMRSYVKAHRAAL